MIRSMILTVLLFAATVYGAERRPQDPTPEELAKIAAAAPKRATAKPLKPRKMLVLSYLWLPKTSSIAFQWFGNRWSTRHA